MVSLSQEIPNSGIPSEELWLEAARVVAELTAGRLNRLGLSRPWLRQLEV